MHEKVARSTRSTDSSAAARLLKIPIAQITLSQAIELVNGWIQDAGAGRTVAFTNVHMLVEAYLHPEFRSVLLDTDLACPDGAPVYWLTRRKGRSPSERIAGPEFMPAFCEQSVAFGWKHFVYGGAAGVAERACIEMQRRFRGIQIAGHYSPPFRTMSSNELDEVAEMIRESGADVVWVCLGCPKQEQWMHEMRVRLPGKVLLAVGQAVDILAGRTTRAPKLVTNMGLEWAYRLAHNPRRLWKRYLVTNLLFGLLVVRDHFSPASSGTLEGGALQ